MTNTYSVTRNQLMMLTVLFFVLLTGSCSITGDDPSESPSRYALDRPYVYKLPIELDEISGVAFYPKDTSILAINDERGWLYKIYPDKLGAIQKWKFADGGDFEDLLLLDSVFYVLKSTGNILGFKFISTDSLFLNEYTFPLGSGNEFEIIYFDPFSKKIIMICKDCESDKKKVLSTFTFDPYTSKFSDSSFTIDVKRIATMIGEKSIKFKPSAAAINPVTNELYIISAINKLLVVADPDGKAKNVFKLSRTDFKQPEGLTFTPTGDMIVSNEAAEIGVANIMIFRYNKKPR
jgi:hypothetical protein